MKSLETLVVLLLLLFGGFCHAVGCLSSLPPRARDIVSALRGWKVVEVADLPTDDRNLWSASHDGLCPGVAVGQFGPGKGARYAIALIKPFPSGELQEQLIVLTPKGESFSSEVRWFPELPQP